MHKGDILLGDRGYYHRKGVACRVLQKGSDVVLRLSSTAFPLLDHDANPLPLLGLLRTLDGQEPGDWPVKFENAEKIYDARLCAIRKSAVAAERAKRSIPSRWQSKSK